MIIRRGVEFWVTTPDGQKVLGRFATRQAAANEEQTLLSQASPNGVPAKATNARDIIVLKSRAATAGAAAALVRKHSGVVRGIRQTADSWRFKQAERDLFVDGSHYTEELEAGVYIVLATPIEQTAYSLLSGAELAAGELLGGLEALYSEARRPAAFGGVFAYDALGALVGPQGESLAQEAFPCVPYGKSQFLRTGSGFWRQDHGAPFAIDKPLLKLIYKNTLIRARPLRGDFMHWTNEKGINQPAMLRPCGWANPADLFIGRWQDPQRGTPELGIFGPVAWEDEGALLVNKGLNQISPVIDWQYTLRHDSGEYKAGTYLGPCITKFALVDEGFFWMDAVRLYKEHESHRGYLYHARS